MHRFLSHGTVKTLNNSKDSKSEGDSSKYILD